MGSRTRCTWCSILKTSTGTMAASAWQAKIR
jgi:hypothetical protein